MLINMQEYNKNIIQMIQTKCAAIKKRMKKVKINIKKKPIN